MIFINETSKLHLNKVKFARFNFYDCAIYTTMTPIFIIKIT